jgi:hemerythrin
MGLIKWNQDLVIGVIEIDQQHQRLVGMINELDEAMKQGKGKEKLGKIIHGLTYYAGTHFQTEEKYFDQFAYPERAEHKKEHAAFTQKVTAFQNEFDKGKIGLSIEVMDFLCNWLQHHIKTVDKKYGPFLKAKGLK